MVDVVSFHAAMRTIELAAHRHLLLGNGFSIALKPDIFSYGSLYDNADFSAAPTVPALFEALDTQDFEVVIRHLQSTATVVEVYRPKLVKLAGRLRRDAAAIKAALVTAIARRHPDRPYDIAPARYAACRVFLRNFEHIFTLNYDVLLYWTLMQSEVDKIDLHHDDGFRHPDDPGEPYVSWQEANSPTVLYLHGALHLFDNGAEITKYTWSKTDTPIVDQIRQALAEDRFPLFVAEGTSASKQARILHNAYLHKALRSFEGCCKPAKNVDEPTSGARKRTSTRTRSSGRSRRGRQDSSAWDARARRPDQGPGRYQHRRRHVATLGASECRGRLNPRTLTSMAAIRDLAGCSSITRRSSTQPVNMSATA